MMTGPEAPVNSSTGIENSVDEASEPENEMDTTVCLTTTSDER
jgi:hypothetical protein